MKINRKKLYNLYMQRVNKIAEECDWVTNFGPKEIVEIMCNVIETNIDTLIEKSKNNSKFEKFTTNTGQRLTVHAKHTCKGKNCIIHNPSNHHMKDWDLIWRNDRNCFERLCHEHGVGHPDPDDINHDGIHGCCGCCQKPIDKHKLTDKI